MNIPTQHTHHICQSLILLHVTFSYLYLFLTSHQTPIFHAAYFFFSISMQAQLGKCLINAWHGSFVPSMLDFQVCVVSCTDNTAKAGLLLWCQRKTAPYNNVNIKDFHMRWLKWYQTKQSYFLIKTYALKKERKSSGWNFCHTMLLHMFIWYPELIFSIEILSVLIFEFCYFLINLDENTLTIHAELALSCVPQVFSTNIYWSLFTHCAVKNKKIIQLKWQNKTLWVKTNIGSCN